jgi:hypothetical protein
MTLFALMGAAALWFLYLWLASTAIAGWLAARKGYNEKAGLATGLCTSAVGVIIWLIVPAKPDSKWKRVGPFGRGKDAPARKQPA